MSGIHGLNLPVSSPQWVLGFVALIFLVLAGGQYSINATIASGYVAFLAGVGGIYAALAMLFKAELAWMCWGLGGKAWPIAFGPLVLPAVAINLGVSWLRPHGTCRVCACAHPQQS